MRLVAGPGQPLFTPADRTFLRAVRRLAFANPFLAERVDAERAALASDFLEVDPARSLGTRDENGARIEALLGALLGGARGRLAAGAGADDEDWALYRDGCLHFLRSAHEARFQQLIDGLVANPALLYRAFLAEYDRLLRFPRSPQGPPEPERVFACGFQIQRAKSHIVSTLIGASRPAAALRAAVWQAIFTCDLRDYLAAPDGCMDDISVLVTGPTGTGKELVARAIGLSGYIESDPETGRFVAAYDQQLGSVNLAALPASLIESELFGHERGSFTGAVKDHRGWLASCERGGTLFLDEIGELDPAIQAKLLRVLETRVFQRLGDLTAQRFAGRIVSATHRDLAAQIAAGTFRHDLYQRLCACSIRTPSLREQLDDAPDERRRLVRFIAGKVRARKAEALTDQVESWIDSNLPPDYAWPGNVRQLWQCVREIFVSGSYRPLDLRGSAEGEDDDPVRSLREGTLTESEAMDRYITIVHARTGGDMAESARVLGVHRHTVARRIDHALLARLKGWATRRKGRPAKRR